jgi:hypothetical protein
VLVWVETPVTQYSTRESAGSFVLHRIVTEVGVTPVAETFEMSGGWVSGGGGEPVTRAATPCRIEGRSA